MVERDSYVNSKIAKPDFLLPEEFVTWYDKEHFMDVLKSGVFREAFRWQALDPSSDRPVLCTYPTVDVALFHSDAMKGNFALKWRANGAD